MTTGKFNMGARRTAQLLSFPAIKGLPAPDLPLQGVAYDKYCEFAKRLSESGKLNIQTKALCEQIGIIHGEQHRRMVQGLSVSAKSFERVAHLLKELRLVDDSDAAPPEKDQQSNRFARFGIIIRAGAQKAEIRGA
jgi:hypothetical protein